MKVSKVNHTKPAVIVKNEDKQQGILYVVPGRENNAVISLKSRIKEKDRAVKLLYNLFNQVQEGTAPTMPVQGSLSDQIFAKKVDNYEVKRTNYLFKIACKELISGSSKSKGINRITSIILFTKNQNNAKVMCSDEEILASMSNPSNKIAFKVSIANPDNYVEHIVINVTPKDLVIYALRKSLNVVVRENDDEWDSKKGCVAFITNLGNSNISKEDRNDIIKFLKLVRADFNKLSGGDTSSEGSKIIRSIENQNMIVQPKNAAISLTIPSDEGKRADAKVSKSFEKTGFDDFLNMYANLDDAYRADCRRRLRRLLEVFFEVPENYVQGTPVALPDSIDKSDFDAFKHHELGKNEKRCFAIVPEELEKISDGKTAINVSRKKELLDTLYRNIRNKNMAAYRFTKAVVDQSTGNGEDLFFKEDNINLYWIHHIENAVERILKSCSVDQLFKLEIGYLREKIWKDLLNQISIKYIAIGKAVFHFALDEIFDKNNDIELGKVSVDGISSFDYEMIKAYETLQREMAVSVAFAGNNLARSVINLDEKSSDIFTMKDKDITNNMKYQDSERSLAAILQFFGGMSRWDKSLFQSAYNSDSDYITKFILDMKAAVYALRNESFHFTTASVDKGSWNMKLVGQMFEQEAKVCLQVEKDKFYSNNLPMFYKQSDLEVVLNLLYKKEAERASQIPAFNTILKRKHLPEYIVSSLKMSRPNFSAEDLDKWYSAMYYLLKEIYYNSFIQLKDAKELFKQVIKQQKQDANKLQQDIKDKKVSRKDYEKIANANLDYTRRCEELINSNMSLSEICQSLMTEYNIQNNNKRKVASANDSIMDKPIFQHYKLLLNQTLAETFAKYVLTINELSFLKTPTINNEKGDAADFLPDWKSEKYSELIAAVKNSPELQKWYITGRFLNPKTLNFLVGTLRSYIQYVNDIEKRAKSTGNKLHKKVELENIQGAIKVIDTCILLSNVFTNNVEDYFEEREEYAAYLSKYVDFYDKAQVSQYDALRIFSSENNTSLYMDAENVILNKNVLLAKLYSPDTLLQQVVRKISDKDVQKFNSGKEKIADYKVKGECMSGEEQRALIEYQQIKNRVELRDLADYGEIINDLLGQLINWSYLRERDLLYFQLGFHYKCLKNSSAKPEVYKTLTRKNGTKIDGAILSQIAGMYINGIGVYGLDKDDTELKIGAVNGGAGAKITRFTGYTEYIINNGFALSQVDSLYNAGLEVFENVNEHDAITDIRDNIDHFKYYSGKTGSILDYYSEVFDRFFTYDTKYQKNVLNLLENILLKHHIIISATIGTGTKKIDREGNTKKRANIEIREIEADKFTYKLTDKNNNPITKVVCDAKNKEFLETVGRILSADDKDSMPEIKIKTKDILISSGKGESKSNNDGKSNKNNSNKKRSNGKRQEVDTEKYHTSSLGYNPFANIKL